jgi:hypothetical protein
MAAMPNHKISFEGRTVRIADQEWDADYPIHDCVLVEDKIVLIYDYTSKPGLGVFRNLEAFDFRGHKLWTAENPTSMSCDAYVRFEKESPITAWNFACFFCTIDPGTGKLLEKRFTK